MLGDARSCCRVFSALNQLELAKCAWSVLILSKILYSHNSVKCARVPAEIMTARGASKCMPSCRLLSFAGPCLAARSMARREIVPSRKGEQARTTPSTRGLPSMSQHSDITYGGLSAAAHRACVLPSLLAPPQQGLRIEHV